MKIYLDLFFVFNVIMDGIILMGVSYLLKRRTNAFRIIISSFLGGLSSLLLFLSINKLLIEVVSVIIMSLTCFKYKNIKYTLKNIIYIYLLSIIIGGLIYLFNIKISNVLYTYLVIIIISIEVIILYIKEMKKIENNYHNYYDICIYFARSMVKLIGFLDTGNNLYDPYKKRPIILIPMKYLNSKNYLLVPCHTVSGESLLKCVKCRYITINGKVIHNVLVGFSSNIHLPDGVEVILHKDLMKGEDNV